MRSFTHKESKKGISTRKRLDSVEAQLLLSNRVIFGAPRHVDVQLESLCPCGGGCPRCNGAIQEKLKIGQPNDIYEQEADRIADQVMRMPEPAVQAKPG
jgi:hypothetical protein